jgi:hypothetical protein
MALTQQSCYQPQSSSLDFAEGRPLGVCWRLLIPVYLVLIVVFYS